MKDTKKGYFRFLEIICLFLIATLALFYKLEYLSFVWTICLVIALFIVYLGLVFYRLVKKM